MTDTEFQGSLTPTPILDAQLDADNNVNRTILFYQHEALTHRVIQVETPSTIKSAFDNRNHNVYSIYVNGEWEKYFFVDFGIYMETDLERAFYLGPANISSCVITDGSNPPKELGRSYVTPILLEGHLWIQNLQWLGIQFYRVSISGRKK